MLKGWAEKMTVIRGATTIEKDCKEEISLSVPYTHYEELFTLTQINVKFQKGKNVVTFRGLESLYLDCIVATYL